MIKEQEEEHVDRGGMASRENFIYEGRR